MTGEGAPTAKGLVLVVEDERPIADLVRLYLTREGFGVHVEPDGPAGLAAARSLHPVAIVLDVGLPGLDGTEVCRRLRAEGNWTPVLFCTARDDEVDRVLGLELGGDDYVTKPFSPRELVARVKSCVRRARGPEGETQTYVVGAVTVDLGRRRVEVDGADVELTATEFGLLAHLVRRPRRVFTREQLLSEVWGYEAAAGTRTVDVHVAQLRAKLGPASPIRTVRGVGYSAEEPTVVDPLTAEPWRRRGGLVGRVTLATTAVALVAVLITGVVAVSLVRGAAEDQARETLSHQADLMAVALDRGGDAASQRPMRLAQVLRSQDIRVFFVRSGAASPGVVSTEDLAALAAGEPVSDVRVVDGTRWLVEARPTDGPADVVLAQPASAARGTAADARRRLLVPLLLGLLGAVVAGWLLARWLARPLQQAAQAAHRLATGARDVRLPVEGPAEVAELSDALNHLSDALATSEGRERQFLLSVSHELRTPLTAVRGYAEALADGVVPSEDVSRTGATVLAESQRLDRLVSDLLDLARLGAQDFRVDSVPTDVGQLVAEAANVWRDRCSAAEIPLLLEVPAEPVVVATDPGRVRQIVDGLAENALRVTPAGAPIVLAVRPEAGEVVVEVRDGGPGLTDGDLLVAFDRGALYERYRGVRQVGTGLGLALVAGLAERLGGRAVAGRAPEGGAAFAVRLPRVP